MARNSSPILAGSVIAAWWLGLTAGNAPGAPGQKLEKKIKINGLLKKDHKINQLKGNINQRVTSSPSAIPSFSNII